MNPRPSLPQALWRWAVIVLVLAFVALGISAWDAARPPATREDSASVVNDVTGLNPTKVDKTIAPEEVDQLAQAVRENAGPISIGGARHSMGGQIATEGGLHLDLRRLNRIIDFSPETKTITVQAGATWRQIQERIDPANLSVVIMQSYANFTVGGSLSVNAHGRYIRRGAIISSVKSIRLVLADGSVVSASPTERTDLFDGAIGGYGALGVIVDATLELTDNVKIKRQSETLAVTDYPNYFADRVQDDPAVIFHNGDIYPPAFTTVRAITFRTSPEPLSCDERLRPVNRSYWKERLGYWVASEWPGGAYLRQHLLDPLQYRHSAVVWRNYEASYDTAELEPRSRARSTYVLQEYFAPVKRFAEFESALSRILRAHGVNVINISIRHASADPDSLLSWARGDVFAFVIYYKQGTNSAAQAEVDTWTNKLIDAALAVDGSFYLPYQIHATKEQFLRAYPRAPEFFQLKRRIDPTNKFRNKLWNAYDAQP